MFLYTSIGILVGWSGLVQEQAQRAEGLGRPRLAAAAVKARIDQRDGAEGSAEPDPALSLAQHHAAAEITASVIDVQIPTSDGRELLLTRYTQPEPDLKLLLRCLKLDLPEQPPPKISAAQIPSPTPV